MAATSFRSREAVTETVELYLDAPTGPVQSSPIDRDVRAASASAAFATCGDLEDETAFRTQFDRLVERLGAWCVDHREKILDAFLTTRGTGLLFLVVTKQRKFDGELQDEVTSLDLDIANEPSLDRIRLSTLVLPCVDEDELRSFVSGHLRLQFHYRGK